MMSENQFCSRPKMGLRYQAYLAIGALGVVFGDVGTSPLYALSACFAGENALEVSPDNILGVLSLIFWTLTLVISIKYLMFVLRADNRGEGGVLALMALAVPEQRERQLSRGLITLLFLGLFGAALLYGDGMITPAISVLSAVEGLKVGTPMFEPYVLPITIGILFFLFLVQSFGTGRIGIVFGPIILVWYFVLAVTGVHSILKEPSVLAAINPLHALGFVTHHQAKGFLVLGSVFLAATGAEALYADMGHFGKRPIRLGWFTVAFPGLILNYLGQGSLLIRERGAVVDQTFFHLAPDWALYPLVILATLATVIASQAVISGCFSLTRQAVQLGYLPRLMIKHTSSEEIGQIYVPWVNWFLLISTVWLVLSFKTSNNLAAAYGVAVSTTMVITTILVFNVEMKVWKWGLAHALITSGLFIVIDLAFFGANVIKIEQGGWFPLLVGAMIFTLMTTWRRGRQILYARMKNKEVPFDEFTRSIQVTPPTRVPGTAVFLTGAQGGAPPALIHNLKHNRVLHERVVIMRVATEDVPHVPIDNRVQIDLVQEGIYKIMARYGFTDTPNVPGVLQLCRAYGLEFKLSETTYFLGRETLLATSNPGMAIWREKLFAFMSANAQRATAFFKLPPDQVIEIGIQVEL